MKRRLATDQTVDHFLTNRRQEVPFFFAGKSATPV
jgi:hypothetical protein